MRKNTDVDVVSVEKADYLHKVIVSTVTPGRVLPPAASPPARWPSERSFWTSPELRRPARTRPG